VSIDDRLPAEPDVGVTAGHDGAPQPTRRGFMKAVGIGGALVAGSGALLPFLTETVGAQQSGGLDDIQLFEVAMTLEYAAAQLYEEALAGGTLDDQALERIREFGPNHTVHGDAIATTLTALSTDDTYDVTKLQVPNAKLYDTFRDRIEAAVGQDATLGILQDLESTLAATHQVLVTTMDDPSDAKTVASVQMVDAQQEVVLARMLSRPLAEYTPTEEPTDGALNAEAYR
jgi:Ferritin-like domain